MKNIKKKNTNIIVVGGAGYIGHVVIDYFLKKKYKIICIDNLVYKNKLHLKNKNLVFIKSDYANFEAYSKYVNNNSLVVFLGGLVGDPITAKYPTISKIHNEVSIKRSINFFLKRKVSKLVFTSTCSNYGIVKNNQIVNEKSKLLPISLYAKSKVLIEKFLKIKSRKCNTIITILRFATAFGLSKRMRFDLTVNQFVRDIYFGKKLEVYDNNTWRPYCHVNDFSKVIYKILTKSKKNYQFNIFNVGSNENNYTKEMIIKKIGKFIPVNHVKFIKKSKDRRNYRVNFNKLKKYLKYQPKINLDYGIKEIIQLLKKGMFKNSKKKLSQFGNFKIIK